MVQNPPLEIFLRELHAKLIENGIAPKRAVRICNTIRSGKKQPTLLSVEDYQEAWIVSDTSSEILTTLEDGSKLAAWSIALAQAVFDFEDAFKAEHGHLPLNAAGPDWIDGPQGNA